MRVTVTLTVDEIMDKGLWEEVCELKGIFIWAVNEGKMEREDEIEFTFEEAMKLGLLKD